MNKLRKALTVGVMVMTVFAMFGFNANAAAPQAGDLIKMDGLSTVYFLGNDGKRYVYPHSSVFFTWHKDFSGVVTVSPSELASYPLGSNVVVRAGTKLVKITTDPAVYVVTPNGVLRKIANEANAINLFGSLWARRVIDVSDAFFTNYTIGTALAAGEVPAGSLVKNANAAAVYYFDGTNYRSIASETAFNANRFDFANLITVTNVITAGGNAITSNEFGYDAQGGSVGVVVTGSGLTASLSSATPVAMSVPQNGARVPMAKINLTAANDGAITVNSITVKRIGLSSYTNIDKVWAEKDGVLVASKKSMNSNDESILTFSPALTVNAGQTVSLDLIASLMGSGAGNIGLSIASASAISATSAAISGSFPINGNLMSPTSYSVVDLKISAANTASATVKVGDEKVELGRFTLGFATTSKDVTVKSIMLKNNGVEDLSKATMNLYLEQAGNKVSTSYTVDGRFVTFYFANGLDVLKDDSSKIFYIKGDVIAKENTATNSFTIILNKSTDLVAYEKATGFGTNVINDSNVAADAFAISNITIDAGAVSVSKKSTSPSDTSIIKGVDNTVLIANVRADEAITADGLKITYGSGNGVATTTDQFENARVYVNGLLLDSFDPAATTSTLQTIDSTFTLNKGDNEIKVMVKSKSTATAAASIKFTLSGSNMFTGMNPEYVVSGNTVSGSVSGTATGATFTVAGATLTTVRNDGYATDKSIVKGSNDVSLGKFTIKASNDDVKITSIALGANIAASNTASSTLATSINDMKLFVDGTQVGSTVDFGTSGGTFSSLNFTVAKDSTKNIELKGSFDTSAAGVFQTVMTINSQDSRGTSITSGDLATTTRFAIVDQGSLNVDLGGNTPAAAILVSKSVEQEVAQFKFTAINDDASLTELNIINTTKIATDTAVATSSADARIASVKLYDGTTLIDSFVPVNGAGRFTITNDKVKVLANNSKTLSIKVVLNDIVNDAAATNQDIHLGVTTLKFKSSNGTENTQSVAKLANNFRVRKTVPTVALLALPTSVLTSGDQVVSKFTVTADANGDVELNKIVLATTNTSQATITALSEGLVLKVNGAFKTVATSTYANNAITLEFGTSNEIISAGTSKTFEVLANLTVSGQGSESVTTKIIEDTNYATDGAGNFVWSDGASVSTYTYSNGYRVPGLTTTTQVLSK